MERPSFEELALALQKELAVVDLLSSNVAPGKIHLQLIKLQRLKIKMYQESHQKPHLHIDYGGSRNHVASYQIDPAACIGGSVCRAHDQAIIRFIDDNANNLLLIWGELQEGREKEAKEIIAQLGGDN